LISKQALDEAVWPNLAVSDDSLLQCMCEPRQKLAPDASKIPTDGSAFTRRPERL